MSLFRRGGDTEPNLEDFDADVTALGSPSAALSDSDSEPKIAARSFILCSDLLHIEDGAYDNDGVQEFLEESVTKGAGIPVTSPHVSIISSRAALYIAQELEPLTLYRSVEAVRRAIKVKKLVEFDTVLGEARPYGVSETEPAKSAWVGFAASIHCANQIVLQQRLIARYLGLHMPQRVIDIVTEAEEKRGVSDEFHSSVLRVHDGREAPELAKRLNELSGGGELAARLGRPSPLLTKHHLRASVLASLGLEHLAVKQPKS